MTSHIVLNAGGLQYAVQYTPSWFEDSFEGTAPSGWSDKWTISDAGTRITTSAAGTPTGGGTYAYRQGWTSSDTGHSILDMYHSHIAGMPATLGDGDEFYLSYCVKYDASFNLGATTGFKTFIYYTNDYLSGDAMYIYIKSSWRVAVLFQTANGGADFFANTNGIGYTMPLGEWVKFSWYVKISNTTNSVGILKGWVNGVLRWDYSNIATVTNSTYYRLRLDDTYNNQITGDNQQRYFDKFVFGPGSMALSHALETI